MAIKTSQIPYLTFYFDLNLFCIYKQVCRIKFTNNQPQRLNINCTIMVVVE